LIKVAETITPQQIASKRTWQTFLSGLVIDVGVAVALLIIAQLDKITDSDALWLFAVSVGKTVVIAAAQYVVRMFLIKPEDDAAVVLPRRALADDES
jgi:hypothetical protein